MAGLLAIPHVDREIPESNGRNILQRKGFLEISGACRKEHPWQSKLNSEKATQTVRFVVHPCVGLPC